MKCEFHARIRESRWVRLARPHGRLVAMPAAGGQERRLSLWVATPRDHCLLWEELMATRALWRLVGYGWMRFTQGYLILTPLRRCPKPVYCGQHCWGAAYRAEPGQ